MDNFLDKVTLTLTTHGFRDETQESIKALVDFEMKTKLDVAAKKYLDKKGAVGSLKISLTMVDGQFSGTFDCVLDTHHARYEREKFAQLQDLIVHGFDHLQQEFLKK